MTNTIQVETSVGLEMVWATLTKRQAEALRNSATFEYQNLLEEDLRVGAALARKGLVDRERKWCTYGKEYVTTYYLTKYGEAVAKHLNREGA